MKQNTISVFYLLTKEDLFSSSEYSSSITIVYTVIGQVIIKPFDCYSHEY